MKKLLLAVVLFASCSSYNDNMNALLAEKSKLTKNQQRFDFLKEMYKDKIYLANEWPISKVRLDSFVKYTELLVETENRLVKVNFSIDSLSKLK